MSMDRDDYVIVGVDLSDIINKVKSEDEIEALQEKYMYRTSVGEKVVISDTISGNYFIVGEILHHASGRRDGLSYNLFGKDEQIEQAKIRVTKFINNEFKMVCIPSVIIKTMWS